MALQGTLETFALPDVLRLLDTTNNTGCLVLTASAGTGSIHVADGEIVGAESTRVPVHRALVEVVFDLLRFADGTFAFEDDVVHDSPESPVEVDETLAEAEAMLTEWREIEKVVPSLDHWVTLATDLPGNEVVVSSARWRTIAAVGGGRSVRGIGDALDLGEVDVSRTVKDLVESGLAVMGEDVGARAASDRLSSIGEAEKASSNGSEPDSVVHDEPEAWTDNPGDIGPAVSFDASELEQSMPDSPPTDNVVQLDASSGDPLADAGISADDAFLADVFPGLAAKNGDGAGDARAEVPLEATTEVPMVPDTPADAGLAELSDEDLARQLANLSPKAAAAVQAAADAPTEEERDAVLDEVEDDEDINRGLLLKFLGSVNN